VRAILFDCKEYKTTIVGVANRPADIEPEPVKKKGQQCGRCIVAFVTVEKQDDPEFVAQKLAAEISKMAFECKRKRVVLRPFAHLSHNLALSEKCKETFDFLELLLKQKHSVIRTHFGSHKTLLLNVLGHDGNIRYREF
jgi:hypothetical protein